MKFFKCFAAFFLLCFLSQAVFAQSTVNTGILNSIVDNFQQATTAWGSTFISAAKFIFFSLALCSFVWQIGQLALKGFEITELFSELIRFIVITGLFYVLLINAPAISHSIFKGLSDLAGTAGSLNSKISPSGIITMGFNRMMLVFEQMPSGIDNLHISLCMAVCAIAIVILCAVIAVNYTLLLCSSYILSYAGIILLGFGGARFSSDIAMNYLKTVISIGIQLMTMILIVSLGTQFMTKVMGSVIVYNEIAPVVLLLISVFIVMYLSLKLPPLIAGIITGSSIGASTGLGAGWGAMMAAAGAAGAAGAALMSGGASAAAGAASTATGTVSAIAEAYKAAGGQDTSRKSDSISAATSSLGSNNDASGSSDKSSSLKDSSSFAGSGRNDAPADNKNSLSSSSFSSAGDSPSTSNASSNSDTADQNSNNGSSGTEQPASTSAAASAVASGKPVDGGGRSGLSRVAKTGQILASGVASHAWTLSKKKLSLPVRQKIRNAQKTTFMGNVGRKIKIESRRGK